MLLAAKKSIAKYVHRQVELYVCTSDDTLALQVEQMLAFAMNLRCKLLRDLPSLLLKNKRALEKDWPDLFPDFDPMVDVSYSCDRLINSA